jgi:Ca2+/H+ antiporter, TMEM165/GDT1 family
MRSRIWIRWTLMFLVIGPIAIFVFGTVVMWLWNNALVPALNIPAITFWQGLGILVLSKILFGNFGGGSGSREYSWRDRMQRKWNRMSPEEKEKFRDRWKSRWWKMGYKPWDTETPGEQKTTDVQ